MHSAPLECLFRGTSPCFVIQADPKFIQADVFPAPVLAETPILFHLCNMKMFRHASRPLCFGLGRDAGFGIRNPNNGKAWAYLAVIPAWICFFPEVRNTPVTHLSQRRDFQRIESYYLEAREMKALRPPWRIGRFGLVLWNIVKEGSLTWVCISTTSRMVGTNI